MDKAKSQKEEAERAHQKTLTALKVASQDATLTQENLNKVNKLVTFFFANTLGIGPIQK